MLALWSICAQNWDMKMTDRNNIQSDLADQMLRRAAQENDVPQDLMARVLREAAEEQGRFTTSSQQPTQSWMSQLWSAFGGWAGAGGLAAASCAGFWIGISPPAGVADATEVFFGAYDFQTLDETGDLTGFGWDLGEG